MDYLKEAIEFMKIQNECLEVQRRLDQERYEKQNERLEKCSNYKSGKRKAIQLFRRIR